VRISELERQLLKRRLAIEPIIGHLKGETGDRLHAVLCAAGYNIRWLLRMIAKKGLTLLAALLLRLRQLATLAPNWTRVLRNFAFSGLRAPAQRLAVG
jgi:IS5 family transposase